MTGAQFRIAVIPFMRNGAASLNHFLSGFCSESGCTRIELQLLSVLYSEQKLPVCEFGARLGITRGNSSSLCKSLEKKGLVRRRRSREDERIVEVQLTPCGKALCCTLQKKIDAAFDTICKEYGDESIAETIAAMQTLNEMLKNLEG